MLQQEKTEVTQKDLNEVAKAIETLKLHYNTQVVDNSYGYPATSEE